jgi:hypothetical protein
MGLFGVLVAAVLVWLLLNLWYMPVLGDFSCSLQPWFVAEAQVEAGDEGCPGSLDEAWNDADWAMDRYEQIASSYRTTALYYLDDGRRHNITSGDDKGPDALRAERALRATGASSIRGRYPAASHVEVKVAAIMRENGTTKGEMVINHRAGPCFGNPAIGLSCQEVLSLVLPPGAILRVWYLPESGPIAFSDFRGR